MILLMPVMNGQAQTREALTYLSKNTGDLANLHVVVWDNASDEPYSSLEFADTGLHVNLVRSTTNIGYYRPIIEVEAEDEIIALMHNDLLILERGWDRRVATSFAEHPTLGILGFYGSNQIDRTGGGGFGQMYNFSEHGQPQSESQRVIKLQPALILDSLFLAIRTECLPILGVDEHTPIGHFSDRIWCLRLIEQGWNVGVLGVHVTHKGGMSTDSLRGGTSDQRFANEARDWCLSEGISLDGGDPRIALFRESERRYLAEFREDKKLIPAHMDGWSFVRGTA